MSVAARVEVGLEGSTPAASGMGPVALAGGAGPGVGPGADYTPRTMQQLLQSLDNLRANVQRVYLGNQDAVDRIIACLLARGHVLIEDVPGVGKTTLANALARSLDCSMARVQMTPDLLPADILGVTIWDQRRGEFEFKAGPIFHNVILADEINRTTPRTQSALLEAMNEGQVSIDGVTRRLVQPFIVIATQNPFEFEGTYFLPESQLDRFLMRIHLGYPRPEEEARVLTLQPSSHIQEVKPVMTGRDLLELQSKVPQVRIDDSLVQYIIRLATATRQHDKVQVGVSTRGTLALAQAARATALMKKRDYVTPDDIQTNVVPVCAHRILARSAGYDGADGRANAAILKQILESVSTPL